MKLLKTINFSEIEDIKTFYDELNFLKEKILLKIHLQYDLSEIELYLKEHNLEHDIINIILDYVKEILSDNRKEYITEKNKKNLISLWYEQFLGFEDTHYADLIIFNFQVQEIEVLYSEFNHLFNKKVAEFIDDLIEKIYNNHYIFVEQVLMDFYKFFNVKAIRQAQKNKREIIGITQMTEVLGFRFPKEHDFGDFLNEDTKGKRPLRQFISRLWKILIGGQRMGNKFMPFFMDDQKIYEDIIKFMEYRLKTIINTSYQQFNKENMDRINQTIDFLKLEPVKEIKRLMKLPHINLRVFEMEWDFMPKELGHFYDGFCSQTTGNGGLITYTIVIHPLSLFLSYIHRDYFQIFIDQLLDHEFIHLLQYRMTHIYDDYLLDYDFQEKYPKSYNFLVNQAPLQLIDEKIPKDSPYLKLKDYMMSYGGHTSQFIKEVNKFRECKRAMDVRGTIQTLYAGLRYKKWGKNLPQTIFSLCDPKK